MIERLLRPVGAGVLLLIAMLALSAAGLLPASDPTVVRAAAPMPALDACLGRGSFRIDDPDCSGHQPRANGPKYGPIDSVVVVRVSRGTPVTLTYPGSFDFETPTRACGDRGCPHHTMLWRAEDDPFYFASDGLRTISGCGATDTSCTVSFAPTGFGDRAEIYEVLYGQHFDGIYPVGGVAYVLYTPPILYEVRLDPVDTSGAGVALPSDYVAYAIRPGANPTQAECVAVGWYVGLSSGPTVASPPCVTFQWDGWLDMRQNWFTGILPNMSGTWTVVGAPQGDASAPLLSRPSPYRHTPVTPRDGDIQGPIVAERRPGVTLDLLADDAAMELGETRTIDVVVSATGGEAGGLEGLVFGDPTVLTLSEGGPLQVLRVLGDDGAPADGGPTDFALARGGSRTIQVEVQAVAPGTGTVSATVSGTDDLGYPVAAAIKAPTSIEVTIGEGGGPGAPEPPLVTSAFDSETSAPDALEGTVAGTPGEEVTVTLASSAVRPDASCDHLLTGPGVTALGSMAVTIGEDGVGHFAGAVPLDAGRYVYGITIADAGVSAVGECTAVAVAMPQALVEAADVTEGTAGRGSTTLEVPIRLSAPTDHAVTVTVSTTDGSATAPDDYASPSGSVTIPAGALSATLEVAVVPDDTTEDDEDLTLTIDGVTGATLEPARSVATLEILDDDGQVATVELRGTWAVTALSDDEPDFELHVTVDDFDPATGDWRGALVTKYTGSRTYYPPEGCKGKVCSYPATGTLRGTKVTMRIKQQGTSIKLSGPLKERGGRLIITLSGIGFDGRKGSVRLEKDAD